MPLEVPPPTDLMAVIQSVSGTASRPGSGGPDARAPHGTLQGPDWLQTIKKACLATNDHIGLHSNKQSQPLAVNKWGFYKALAASTLAGPHLHRCQGHVACLFLRSLSVTTVTLRTSQVSADVLTDNLADVRHLRPTTPKVERQSIKRHEHDAGA